MVFIAANGGLEFVRAMGEPIQKFMLLRIQTLKNWSINGKRKKIDEEITKAEDETLRARYALAL